MYISYKRLFTAEPVFSLLIFYYILSILLLSTLSVKSLLGKASLFVLDGTVKGNQKQPQNTLVNKTLSCDLISK